MDLPEPITRTEQYLYAIATGSGGGGGGGGDWQSVTLLTETEIVMQAGMTETEWVTEQDATIALSELDLVAVEISGDIVCLLTGCVGNNGNLEIYGGDTDNGYSFYASHDGYTFVVDGPASAPTINVRIAKIVPVSA